MQGILNSIVNQPGLEKLRTLQLGEAAHLASPDAGLPGETGSGWEAYRVGPELSGNLKVDPEISLRSPGMDVEIGYFYNSDLTYTGPYGNSRTITPHSWITAEPAPFITYSYSNYTPTWAEVTFGDGTRQSFSAIPDQFQKYAPDQIRNLALLELVLLPSSHWKLTLGDGRVLEYPAIPWNSYPSDATMMTDLAGNTHTYTYYSFGTYTGLKAIQDAVGRLVTFNYSSGRLESIQDWAKRLTTFQYNGSGQLTVVTGPTGCQTQYGYSGGKLNSIQDPNGNVSTYSYDGSGRVKTRSIGGLYVTRYDYYPDQRSTTVTLADGSKYEYYLNPDWTLHNMRDPAGGITTYAYNSYGFQSEVWDPAGNHTITPFDGKYPSGVRYQNGLEYSSNMDEFGNVLSITTPFGGTIDTRGLRPSSSGFQWNNQYYQTLYEYNQYGQLKRVRDPLGCFTTISFDTVGNLRSVIDPYGAITTFQCDLAGNITTLINAYGKKWTYTYDAQDRLTSATTPLGQRTQYGYDNNGNLTAVVDPMGNRQDFGYNIWDKVAWASDARGYLTTYSYDSLGRLVTVTNALGETSQLRYDPVHRTQSVEDPQGFRTTTTFDSRGNASQLTDPLGRSMIAEYDSAGMLEYFTLPNGGQEQFSLYLDSHGGTFHQRNPLDLDWRTELDEYGRIESLIDPVGDTTSFWYDRSLATSEWITAVTDARGKKATFLYDCLGRLKSATNQLGFTQTYTYDSLGRPSLFIDPAGNVSSLVYDAAGRVIAEINPLGQRSTYAYDAADRLTTFIDANGFSSGLVYNKNGYVNEVRDALGYSTLITYDKLNRPVAVTDANGNITTYGYSSRGLITTQIDAGGGVTKYSYDAAGQMTGVNLPNGLTTLYGYSPLGQVTSVIYPDSQRLTFMYDLAGQRTTMVDAFGATGYQYYADGLLKSETNPSGQVLAYEYAKTKVRKLMTNPQGGLTTYLYDEANQPINIINPYGEVTTIGYNPLGQIRTLALANGVIATQQYDPAARPATLLYAKAATVLMQLTVTRDAVGNPTAIGQGNASTAYLYDHANQLTEEYRTGTNAYRISYTYDGAGNRLSMGQSGQMTQYRYGPMNQLLTFTDASGRTTYTYDEIGNVKLENGPAGRTTYTWDSAQRLKSAQVPSGGMYTSLYDGDGRRARFATPNGITDFVWDGVDLLQEQDGLGALLSQYTLLPDQLDSVGRLLSQRRGAASSFYASDLMGNVRQLQNSAGSITDTYLNTAFGAEVSVVGTTVNPFRFGGGWGYQRDRADLIYVRNRFYEPSVARWLSQDPIGFAGSWNLYGYVNNFPTTSVDPLGLIKWINWKAPNKGAALVIENSKSFEIYLNEALKYPAVIKSLKDMGISVSDVKHVMCHWEVSVVWRDDDGYQNFKGDTYDAGNDHTYRTYLQIFGKAKPKSITRVLFHELIHAARLYKRIDRGELNHDPAKPQTREQATPEYTWKCKVCGSSWWGKFYPKEEKAVEKVVHGAFGRNDELRPR